MASADDIDDMIDDQAVEPLSLETEHTRTQNRSLDELGRAADRKRRNESSGLGFLGIGKIKFNPPGAV